jgi:hypothetical protein
MTVGLAGGTGSPSATRADPPVQGDVEQRWRFGVDLDLLYWRGVFTRPDRTHLELDDSSFGVIGYQRVPVTLAFSYAFRDWFLCGARLGIEVEPYQPKDAPILVDVHGNLGPFIELLFLRRREVRPFVYFDSGVAISETFVALRQEKYVYDLQGARTLYPFVGVGLGAHAFLTDDLSFDAMIVGRHRWVYANRILTEPGSEEVSQATGYRLQSGTLVVSLAIGLSRWF